MARPRDNKDRARRAQRRSPQVPGQYLGYSLQATRFVQLLLESGPGAVVSLELFEDVGTESSEGTRLASQVKSAPSSNPIGDRSVAFWKTLANWLEAVGTGRLDVSRTVFEIYVSPRREGRIAELFAGVATEEAAATAIAEAKSSVGALKNEAPSTPDEPDVYIERVLNSGCDLLRTLLPRFQLTFPSVEPFEDILSRIATTQWLPTEYADLLMKHALGWVKQTTDMLIQNSKPAAISVDDFNREMRSFARRCDLKTILTTFSGRPSPEAVEHNLLRKYVRQLEIIDAIEEDKIHAINDYLRASVDRTEWSRRGIVHQASLEEFEDGLIQFWKNRRRQVEITQRDLAESERGMCLYCECGTNRPKLQGLEVPNHFTPGSYHALADSETIGWHPDYKSRLKETGSGPEE